jgi:TRAP-type C4-dicarboxylate transport system permease small subunit
LSAKIINKLDSSIKKIEGVLQGIILLMFFVLMLLGSGDVLGRYLFNSPIIGTKEISSILVVGIVVLGWARTQARGAQINVTLIISRFSQSAQAKINFITTFLSLILFSLIVWQSIKVAIRLWESERLVNILLIPLAPFQLIVTLGALILCLEFIIELVHLFRKIRGAD